MAKYKAPKKPPPEGNTLRFTEDTDYYGAGGVHVVPTLWVTQLMFLTPAADADGMLTNRADVVVSLPWPLAEALHKLLGTALEEYKATEGAIHLPHTFSAQLAEASKESKGG